MMRQIKQKYREKEKAIRNTGKQLNVIKFNKRLLYAGSSWASKGFRDTKTNEM